MKLLCYSENKCSRLRLCVWSERRAGLQTEYFQCFLPFLTFLKRNRFGGRRAVTAPDTSPHMRDVVQKASLCSRYNDGEHVGFHSVTHTHTHTHTHTTTAAIRVANQTRSIFNSFTLSHRGTQAFLRSNSLTPFLWLWCPFCFSSQTTKNKNDLKKINK